jgi:hypothetical protein
MFENKVLRRIFGPKRDEVTRQEVGENCRMRNLSSIIRMMKSRRMRWGGMDWIDLAQGRN